MKKSTVDAKNIIIRGLDKSQNKMLKSLREEFGSKYNNTVVMKASQGYLDRGKEISKLEQSNRKHEDKVNKLTGEMATVKAAIAEIESSKLFNELKTLRGKVKEYFAEALSFNKGEAERRKEIETLLIGSIKKGRKQRRNGRG